MKTRAFKKDYEGLFNNPGALFTSGPDNMGAHVHLWPNGAKEIWITSKDGTKGIAIEASEGPAGFGIRIRTFVGAAPLTVFPENDGAINTKYLEMCQYNPDAKSQAFRSWYESPNKNPHPGAMPEFSRRTGLRAR